MCVFCRGSTLKPIQIQPRTGSLEARIQAIEADNQRIVGMCTGGGTMSAPISTCTIVSSCHLTFHALN